MRAIVQDRYGPYREVLRLADVPDPTVGPGQVLVRVRATSVHADVWHAVTGIPYVLRVMGSGVRAPKQPIPGTDLSGEVVALGPGADRFTVGERVLGEVTRSVNLWGNAGAFAEFVVADEAMLAPTPEHLSDEEAAAVPTAALIALANLPDPASLSGRRVLVNGAGGAVGTWAVQLAKAFGAEVIGVEVPAKLELVQSLGAAAAIDGTEQDYSALGQRYDVILDVVSQMPFRQARRALEPDGRYVMIGHDHYGRSGRRLLGGMGPMLPLLLRAPFTPQLSGITSGPPRPEQLATIVGLLGDDRIRPVVDDRIFDLAEAVAALDHLASGAAMGRVVLRV